MSTFNIEGKKIEVLSLDPQQMCWNIFESVKSGIYLADNQGNLTYVNQTLVNMLGYKKKEELLGVNLAKKLYVKPKDREVFLTRMKDKGYLHDYEIRLKKKGGSVVILSVTSNFVANDEGNIFGVEGVVNDVTEKKQLEKQLALEKKKLEEILNFDEKVGSIRKLDRLYDFIVERTSRILEADRCSLMLFDKHSQALCIKASKGLDYETISKAKTQIDECVAGLAIKEGEPLFVTNATADERLQKRSDTNYLSNSFICMPIKLDQKSIGVLNVTDRKVNGNYTVFSKIDLKILYSLVREIAVAMENVKLYKELKFLTVTDPLTHMYNYRQFSKSLDHQIKTAKRYLIPLSLIMMDIDNFKNYNDSFGHNNGDLLLKRIGHLFQNNLRDTDVACRYAGDEFIAILPQTDIEGAEKAANNIKSAIETSHFKKRVSCSMGIAKYSPGMTRHDLFMKVDQALYQAKKSGKSRICSYG